MKKFMFILLLIVFFTARAFPQSYNMVVTPNSGQPIRISVRDIQSLTFEGDGTNATELKKFVDVLTTFRLLQNYPNPFNPSTTIEYFIPTSGRVIVQILDINGRLIKTILDGEQTEGTHKLLWTGRDAFGVQVATGVYFCNVTFNRMNISKKLLLIK